MKIEIDRLLTVASDAHLNALYFQVRAEGDALYPSPFEPWSRFLTGVQGQSPGFDPLAYLLDGASKLGIAVHAWLNPYRAAVLRTEPLAANHPARRLSKYTYRIGSMLWFDPASKAVQDEVINVVTDLLTRYDLAGIHLDDYFYPYPTGKSASFPDHATFLAYQKKGGNRLRADWRRDNVNTLIERLSQVVKAVRPTAIFGISPFGIYRPGQPAEVKSGLDQFSVLYSDPLKWMQEGWVDYLAPQLYWRDQSPQSFSALLRWWRSPEANPKGIPIYPGILSLNLSTNWPLDEITQQMELTRSIPNPTSDNGFILFSLSELIRNTKGILDALKSDRF